MPSVSGRLDVTIAITNRTCRRLLNFAFEIAMTCNSNVRQSSEWVYKQRQLQAQDDDRLTTAEIGVKLINVHLKNLEFNLLTPV